MVVQVLRREVSFRWLLSGAAAGQVAAQISLVALPFAAVLELHASAFTVGLLTVFETAAFLLIGLPAGAWLDRWPRRPMLIRSDVVRGLVIGSVPAAAFAGMLTMAQLYVVAFVVGVATVFFDVAHQSLLPRMLAREQLLAGNSALQVVRSSAEVGAPALTGGVIQLVGAPFALALNSLNYFLSAAFLWRVDVDEPLAQPAPGTSLRAQIAGGLSFVFRHPLLRPLVLSTAVANLFAAMLLAVQTVYLVRVLGLPAGGVGLVFSAIAVGGLAGALSGRYLAGLVGQTRAIVLSATLTGPFALLLPIGVGRAGAWCFTAGAVVLAFGAVVYNIAQVSLRQQLCPDELLGRMNATLRFVVWGCMPMGALAGATIAGSAGPRTAVWVSAIGLMLAPLPLVFSPLRRLQGLPTSDDRPVQPIKDEYV
jgi:MFS family permease